jgi:hypothetical protein
MGLLSPFHPVLSCDFSPFPAKDFELYHYRISRTPITGGGLAVGY